MDDNEIIRHLIGLQNVKNQLKSSADHQTLTEGMSLFQDAYECKSYGKTNPQIIGIVGSIINSASASPLLAYKEQREYAEKVSALRNAYDVEQPNKPNLTG